MELIPANCDISALTFCRLLRASLNNPSDKAAR
jgi:hypothetical protein